MTKVSMIAPKGASGMSIEGIRIDVIDGVALVDAQYVDLMRSHGFSTEDGPLVTGSRAELIQMIAIPARAVAESLSDDELRAFSALSEEKKVEFWEGLKTGIQKYPEVVETQKINSAKADAEAAAKLKADAEAAAKLKTAEVAVSVKK